MRPRLLGILLLAVAAALAVAGTRSSSFGPQAPQEQSLADFLRTPTKATWVRLAGGRLDLLEGARVRSRTGEILAVVAPLRVEESRIDGPIQVVVRLRKGDPVFDLLRQGDALSGPAEAGAFLQRNREAMVPRRPVEGVVRPGTTLGERDLRLLQGMRSKLTPDFVLVEEGQSPEPPVPARFFYLLGGACAVAGGLLILRRPGSAPEFPAEAG